MTTISGDQSENPDDRALLNEPGLLDPATTEATSAYDDDRDDIGDLMRNDTDPLPDQLLPDPLPGAQQESDAD